MHVVSKCLIPSMLGLILVGVASVSAESTKDLTPAAITANVFLGQLYPSGNLYLRSFQENDEVQELPPAAPEVLAVALTTADPAAADMIKGNRSHVMKDVLESEPRGNISYSEYIPNLEQMEDSHQQCGKAPKKKKNSAFSYLGEDFFDSAFDNCGTNNAVAVYKTNYRRPKSYSVVAFGAGLRPGKPKLISGSVKRPLSEAEKIEVAKFRRETQSGCTTEPRFLDSAEQLVMVPLENSKYGIRISSYRNPGCAGHLAKIYLLDVMEDDRPVTTFRLLQYKGLL